MRFQCKQQQQPVPLSFLRPTQVTTPFLSVSNQLRIPSTRSNDSFAIAFDIDGVILGGKTPIGNSPAAVKRLFHNSGSMKVPFVFLTNGSGTPESRRASELSGILGVNILPFQVLQGHSPFRNLLQRFENEFIVATGKGEPGVVMSEYGFKRAISLDKYASYFANIDPVAQYKKWTTMPESKFPSNSNKTDTCVFPDKVKAVFVVSDVVDWGRDIQVLCDILSSGGLPGEKNEHQPPLYFAADDLEYKAAFPSERLGLGAFRIALESVFNRIHDKPLEYTIYGKPNPFVFEYAETTLKHLRQSSYHGNAIQENEDSGLPSFRTIYMIGDNPLVDVKGAKSAGDPWFSILTRTGVFRKEQNHELYPADVVVDTVEEAIEFILKRENASYSGDNLTDGNLSGDHC